MDGCPAFVFDPCFRFRFIPTPTSMQKERTSFRKLPIQREIIKDKPRGIRRYRFPVASNKIKASEMVIRVMPPSTADAPISA